MRLLALLSGLFLSLFSVAQSIDINESNSVRKGRFYVYWGWNVSSYSLSDVKFQGDDYNFTLIDASAHDRPTDFDFKYINPLRVTNPQYNFRLGYFINEKYSISVAMDHMKYVLDQFQTASIEGEIATGSSYDGVYESGDEIYVEAGFLLFEHTDGLNYVNAELRRLDEIYKGKFFDLNLITGAGVGFLMPRTDATLLGFERHDEFHISGYGVSIVTGIQLALGKTFFIQSEWKGEFINMSHIRTTESRSDIAKQHFFYSQNNIVFGANFGLPKLRN